jgi:RNA polymerase sigma-70 factor (ECF subfamily)
MEDAAFQEFTISPAKLEEPCNQPAGPSSNQETARLAALGSGVPPAGNSLSRGVDVTGHGRQAGSRDLQPEVERDLIERARQGDTQAYGRLVLAHQDRIFGLVLRMVRDPLLAEELTQDVFLKAFRGLSGFREAARFTTWLYRIAVNLCHDERQSLGARNRARETGLEGDPPVLVDSSPGTRPDEAVEASEAAAHFQAGFEALEPKYREAFLLRHQEGLSYEEIASVLEISQSNAKVRVHRAREMILEVLRSRGFEV